MGLGMILLIAAAHAACPPLDEALEVATAKLVDGADPSSAFTAVETSLACGPATPAQLARLWLLRGAAFELGGDPAAAEPYYAAAATLDSTVWDERLGPAVKASLAAAKHGNPGNLQANRPVDVDGVRKDTFPLPLDSGPHALQAPEVDWARVVVVVPGETILVDIPTTRAIDPSKRKKSAAWAVAGSVALAGAVGCGVGAILQTEAMADAPSVDTLEAAWGTQQLLGGGTIVLGALGATGVVLQVALP